MAYIYSLILTYKYAILLPIAIVKGPIIIIIGGFLASIHVLNIFVVYVIAVLGDVIGDSIYYWIGRYGRHSILPKYGNYIGVTEERIQYAERHYDKHLLKTILFFKFTQVAIATTIVVAGITKTDFRKFITIIFFVSLVKGLIFTLIGYYFGKSYVLIGHYLDTSIIDMTILFAVIVIGYFLYRRFKK